MQRRDNQPFKYLFIIWFTLVPEKDVVKLNNTWQFDFSCSTKIHPFGGFLLYAKQNIQINKLWHDAKYLAKWFLMQNNSKRFSSL